MTRMNRVPCSGYLASGWMKVLSHARRVLEPGCERGSALVEMAITVWILIMLFVGISRLCLGLYTMDFLSQAAREGARWKIVRGNTCSTNTPGLDHCGATQSDIQTHVQGLGFPFASAVTVTGSYLIQQITLSASGAPTASWVSSCSASSTVLCNSSTTDDTPGNQVTVTVSYTFQLKIPFLPNASLPMTSNSSMVIVQ